MFLDLHCHCLPGLDDGPPDLASALALCRALVADGVHTVCATPHQLGRYPANTPARIGQAVRDLQEELKLREIPLQVLPGADVRVDERLPSLLAAGEASTLAGQGQWYLLELPEVFVDCTRLFAQLRERGIGTVLTHPERYPWTRRHLGALLSWRNDWEVKFQITAASLLGEFGPAVETLAWNLLLMDAVDLAASDAHAAQGPRRPCLTPAMEQVSARCGEPLARRLFLEAPREIVRGRIGEEMMG